jgi:hypothetical protein
MALHLQAYPFRAPASPLAHRPLEKGPDEERPPAIIAQCHVQEDDEWELR